MLTRTQENRVNLLEAFFGIGQEFRQQQAAALWDEPASNAAGMLNRLINCGYVARPKRGVYVLIKKTKKSEKGA